MGRTDGLTIFSDPVNATCATVGYRVYPRPGCKGVMGQAAFGIWELRDRDKVSDFVPRVMVSRPTGTTKGAFGGSIQFSVLPGMHYVVRRLYECAEDTCDDAGMTWMQQAWMDRGEELGFGPEESPDELGGSV